MSYSVNDIMYDLRNDRVKELDSDQLIQLCKDYNLFDGKTEDEIEALSIRDLQDLVYDSGIGVSVIENILGY